MECSDGQKGTIRFYANIQAGISGRWNEMCLSVCDG